jgi:lysine-specific demethylase 3
MDHHREIKSENNQHQLPQPPQGSSTGSDNNAPAGPPSAASHYVHKLKKAWIKSYTEEDPLPPSGPFEQPHKSSADAKKLAASESYSAPSTPSNNNNSSRATPSPALSSVSAASKSGKKVNGHASSTSKNDESELSSDSGSNRGLGSATSASNKPRGGGPGGKSSNGRGGKKVSHTSVSGRGSAGQRGSGQRLRGPSNKTSDNDTLSDSDDNSKDSDTSHATSVHSRRSGSTAGGGPQSSKGGKRGRKPGRKSANGRGGAGDRGSTTSASAAAAKSSSHHLTASEAKEFDFDTGLNETVSSGAGSSSVHNGRKQLQQQHQKSGVVGSHHQIRMPKENPFNNPPMNVLKKTGESFLQDADCFKVAPKLGKCRECKWSQHNKNAGSSASIFCRFYGFRRLRYHPKNGQLAVSGFCDPRKKKDVTSDDAEMWEASADNAPEGLTVHQAKYCLELLKTDFDLIVKEERQAVQEHVGDDKVSWKRVVQGVSESCDVCDATLFNLHWACPRCGFVVCLHCYTGRKNEKTRENSDNLVNGGGGDVTTNSSSNSKNDPSSSTSGNGSNSSVTKDDKDKFAWLLCTNRSQHDLDKLMLTQIVTGEALEELTEKLNACGVKFKIANSVLKAGNSKVNGIGGAGGGNTTTNGNKDNNKGASLRDLIGSEQKVKMSDIIDACVEDSMEEQQDLELKYFVRETDLEEDKTYKWRHGFAPKRRSYSLVETKNQYHNVPHSWLANGHVLKIEETTSTNTTNESSSSSSSLAVDLFQEIWSRGQPVVVANTTKALISKWYPTGLNEEFGDELVELVNIKTNKSLGEHPLKKFWDGYGCLSKRLKDGHGQPAVVRLSGWPGNFGEEFKDTLPSRSAEFLRTLPMPCYTGRSAPLNLAASLPEPFARAEVGPRATITYGDLNIATSIGLRDERADSVVVLIHAQIPKNDDIDAEGFRAKAIETMESLGCDTSALTKAREERLPAAVWTLFHPADGDKIRDFLNKGQVSEKRPLNYDPVTMDNNAKALNEVQLKKLKDEYDVKPYVIAQFPGEALFIPAGSLRQVKHLLSSISLESDFVCPENVSQSFFMYRQLRHLPESQKQPIVDKLSVKNLIFHSVKNALATLERNKINGTKDEEDLEDEDDDDDDDKETEDDN